MVWMMSLPTGFGEFWPDGNFEDPARSGEDGWYARLKAGIKELPEERRKQLMPSGDWFDYPYFVGHKFFNEIGSTIAVDLPPLAPINVHEPPTTFNTEKSYKQLGDLIALNSGLVAVSEDLKTIIEGLERGVHQFFPIEIVQPRSVYPKQFYTLVIGNFRESFHDTDGVFPTPAAGERYRFGTVNKKEAPSCHFQKSEFGASHIWRERLFLPEIINLSDELVARIQQVELRTPKLYQAKEID